MKHEIIDQTLDSFLIVADWLEFVGKYADAWRVSIATYEGFRVGIGSGEGIGDGSGIGCMSSNQSAKLDTRTTGTVGGS